MFNRLFLPGGAGSKFILHSWLQWLLLNGMPLNLLLIRHGSSEGNLYYRARAGKLDIEIVVPDEFKQRPSSDWRLIDEGIAQSTAAGGWVRNEFSVIHRGFVSTDLRAGETAGHMEIDDLLVSGNWDDYPRQCERSWGIYGNASSEAARAYQELREILERDPLRTGAIGGELLFAVIVRACLPLYHKLKRELSMCNVAVVCHGEVMWGHIFELCRMSPMLFKKLHASNNPHHRIHNGQIIHFTRQNPGTKVAAPYFTHVRSVCPWDESLSSNKWQKIIYKRHSGQELIERAERVPRLLNA